jgi:hypothetical protein
MCIHEVLSLALLDRRFKNQLSSVGLPISEVVMRSFSANVSKFFVASCLALASFSAYADCAIVRVTSADKVRQALKHGGGYSFGNYDEVCEKLRRANAVIVISGSDGVLANRSFAWASIGVADAVNQNVMVTAFSTNQTIMDEYASAHLGPELLMSAIDNALNSWTELDTALAELNNVRQKMHKAASK